MYHTERVRKAIRAALKIKGWTHYRLAKEAGLRVSTVDTAINGGGMIQYETVQRLLNALDRPILQ